MKSLFVLLCLLHSVLAVRQYVEIERRPGSAHDFAGTLAFVFGLTATFFSVIIMLLFGWAFFRDSTGPQSQSQMKPSRVAQTISSSIRSIKFDAFF